ncbi:MAG: aldo/keto reductase [Candidatus Sumerlaeia bacterium]
MQYRKLGKWGLPISVLSVGNHIDWGKNIPDEQTEEIMVTAYEAGVNYIDTAEKYAEGRCTELLAQTMRKHNWPRESIILGTKISVRGLEGAPPTNKGMHRKHIVELVEKNLKLYKTDYLDLLFCHRPDPAITAEEVVTTMNHLIRQGKILHWGTSDHDPTYLMEMFAVAERLGLEGPAMEQTWYNLFGRKRLEQDLLPLFKRYGMGITAYQPLCGGILTGKYIEGIPEDSRMQKSEWQRAGLTENRLNRVRQLKAIADELDAPMPAFALAWTMKNPDMSTCIAGARTVEHVKTNLQSLDIVEKLDDEIMQRIAEILGDELQIE